MPIPFCVHALSVPLAMPELPCNGYGRFIDDNGIMQMIYMEVDLKVFCCGNVVISVASMDVGLVRGLAARWQITPVQEEQWFRAASVGYRAE